MPNNFTSSTFTTTYKDDYRDSDSYYRILFNSGRALQARELTQSQTIIQEEIARFGRNIFKEGAAVNPGGATVDNKIEFIKLDTSTYTLPTNSIVGNTFTVNSSGDDALQFEVVQVIPAEGSDPATLFVKYTDKSAATDTTSAIRVADSATFISGSTTLQAAATNATGTGTKAYIADGDFFTQGHFVFAPKQELIISKYSSRPTVDIGFKLVQDIVTESDDDALYDNQGSAPNISSPGAHRYRIRLIAATRDQVQSDENFVYVARVVNGSITTEVTGKEDYNILNDLLALRTKEESGDYVAEQFKAIFSDLDATNLNLDVTEGVAYVDGYRLDLNQTDLTVPKARDTLLQQNDTVVAQYGNYVYGNPATNEGLPNINAFSQVNLRSGANYTGTTIGTARVRAVEKEGSQYRFYLFEINMNAGQNFRSVRSFGTGSTNNVDVVLENNIAQLKSTANNTLLFSLPNSRPKEDGIADVSYTAQKRYIDTSDGSGVITIIPGTNETLVDLSSWIVCEDGATIDATAASVTYNGSNVEITGLSTNASHTVIGYVQLEQPSIRSKVLNTGETLTTSTIDSDGSGNRFINLPHADIYRVTQIKQGDANGTDLYFNFTVDDGQRDNYYDNGRLLVKGGASLPAGNIFVEYDYFSHGNGDFFCVNSYNNVVDYEDIPSHTLSTGTIVSLRDVLDFRPVKGTTGNYSTNGGKVNALPKNTAPITSDITYYLPRTDVLVASATDSKGRVGRGELKVIQGVSALQPRAPIIPTGSLALYTFQLNAFTLSETDLTSTFIPNKRFTMKDIANLEQRVDDLYELTTLSLLENNTNSLTVLDDLGNPRTKSGFIADNFTSFDFSDVSNTEFRSSLETQQGEMKPSFREHSVRLAFNSNDAGNTALHSGDVVTLPFTDQVIIDQALATSTMNVNPFAVITQTGHMTLSPASDEWVETRTLPDIVQRSVRRTTEFRNRDLDRIFTAEEARRRTFILSSVVTTDVQQLIGTRIADVEIIPFMRSRKVSFKVQGLRPNTKMFAFFGGKDVSNFVRQESTFVRFSDNPQEVGSEFINATQHPDGPTPLVTDSKGELVGSFFVPNNSSLKFRTGTQSFKLLDISVNLDDNATSRTEALYTSTGTLNSIQRTIRSTRIVTTVFRQFDPLAQSFFVDQIENPNGIFLSKVRIYAATKDSTIPLQLQIRPVENGIPTTRIVPGSVVFTDPADINIPTDTNDITSVRNAFTDIEFEEPIYLTPGEEFAVVLLAESVEYNVYVAQTNEFILGSTEARVDKQPALGSLFLSQNASTWTPDQTKDLMFGLFRCEFDASATVFLENAQLPNSTLQSNPFQTTSGDASVKVLHQGHGFVVNDKVTISGVDAGADIGGIAGSAISGSRTIVDVNWDGYFIEADTAATSTLRAGGDSVVVSEQVMYDEFIPQVQTLLPNDTSIVSNVRKTSGASFGTDRNSITNSAYAYGTYENVFLGDLNKNASPALVATAENETLNLSGEKSFKLKLDLSTLDTKVSPVIDLQRASILALENVIDNGYTANGVPDFELVETDPSDGTAAAKHVTTPTVIDESAVGLKIIFGANRPSNASFEVYIKTAIDDVSLADTNWVEVDIENAIPADDNESIFRQYEYLAGGPGGDLDPFTTFQVKVVMKSTNSSKVPTVRDLRVIALAV